MMERTKKTHLDGLEHYGSSVLAPTWPDTATAQSKPNLTGSSVPGADVAYNACVNQCGAGKNFNQFPYSLLRP